MAKYFTSLPNVDYSLRLNGVETKVQAKSINTKVTFSDLTKQTTDNFYPYVMQPGDRLDTIGQFYYDDPYRFWFVLLSNDAADMYYDFSLEEQTFERYLNKKYKSEATSNGYSNVIEYLQDTILYYKDSDGDIVDVETYNSLSPLNRSSVNIYEHEVSLNEERRNIRLVSNQYTGVIETQFKDLMKVRKES